MPRREHRKSRNGCVECKRRHIKCDEKRPRCSHCTASERTCEYAKPVWRNITGRPARKSPSTTTSHISSPSTTNDGGSIPRSQPQDEPDNPPANMLHFELLHHVYTQTGPSLDAGFQTLLQSPDIPTTILSTPYLLNEILAFGALHKSTLYPASSPHSAHYRHHAAQLQTHALSLFNTSININPDLPVTQDNCVPLFLFASTLGMHLLCDTLVYRSLHCDVDPSPNTEPIVDFDPFLDRFISYLRLHRGVRSIVSKAWHILRESSLKPFFQSGEAKFRHHPTPTATPTPIPSPLPSGSSTASPLYSSPSSLPNYSSMSTPTSTSIPTQSTPSTITTPCETLMKRIESARLGPELTSTYRQTIDALQLSINANSVQLDETTGAAATTTTTTTGGEVEGPARTITSCSGTTGWPVLLTTDYLDLLALRRPEALVILAHYAVLVHESRGLWVVGDGGRFLIESIVGYLGVGEWGEWLKWPVSCLRGSVSI